MTDTLMHDTLYAPNGGFIPEPGGNSDIWLRKRYSSMVCCPESGFRRPGTMYPRCICLTHNGEANGMLLATMEWYSDKEECFPIYKSCDGGKSWQRFSKIVDINEKGGCRFQPHLFEVPCDMGTLKEGTILCAGNVISQDFSSTSIRLFKSEDRGKTWEYVSEILKGGRMEMSYEKGAPVWEPFLLDSPDGKLYCYYSDERYKAEGYNQLLAHKVSRDGGLTWGDEKIDVAFADGSLRPGMPIVAHLPNHKFIMVYEMVNEDRIPVYFRISESMDDWGNPDFMGNPVISEDGSYPTGTPYVMWTGHGGEEGTILVSGRGYSQVFANSRSGKGFWEKMPVMIEVDNHYDFSGYSQCMISIEKDSRILFLCPRQISDKHAMIESAVADIYERV